MVVHQERDIKKRGKAGGLRTNDVVGGGKKKKKKKKPKQRNTKRGHKPLDIGENKFKTSKGWETRKKKKALREQGRIPRVVSKENSKGGGNQ